MNVSTSNLVVVLVVVVVVNSSSSSSSNSSSNSRSYCVVVVSVFCRIAYPVYLQHPLKRSHSQNTVLSERHWAKMATQIEVSEIICDDWLLDTWLQLEKLTNTEFTNIKWWWYQIAHNAYRGTYSRMTRRHEEVYGCGPEHALSFCVT